MRDFRKLEVWKEGVKLAIELYNVSKRFPVSEQFGITQQINKSALSIPSNIAEGASRRSSKEFSRFIEIALGSSFELETQLLIVGEIGFIGKEILNKLLESLDQLQRKMNALKKSIE